MNRFTLNFKFGSFLMIFLLLVGFAATGQVGFDKVSNTHIKTIALFPVDEPEPKEIMIAPPPVNIIYSETHTFFADRLGHAEYCSNIFRDAINDHYIQFSPAMVNSLQKELTKKGYDVICLEDKSLIKDIQTDADAILYVGIFKVGYSSFKVGYSLFQFSQKYTDIKPDLFVCVRLYDSRSKRVIYARHIVMVEVTWSASVIHMLPDEEYKYSSFDQLMKNFKEAVQGIKDCQHKIAARIAEDLK